MNKKEAIKYIQSLENDDFDISVFSKELSIEEINNLPPKQQIEAKMKIINNNDLDRIPSSFLPDTFSNGYFFVSYSQKDYKKVYCDIFYLEYEGVNIWYDRGNPPGKNWKDFVLRNISPYQCKGVLIYLSENSLVSPSVMEEIELVSYSGKPFIAITIPFTKDYFYKGKSVKGVHLTPLKMIDVLEENNALDHEIASKLRLFFDEDTLYLPYKMLSSNKAEKIKLAIPTIPLLNGVCMPDNEGYQCLHIMSTKDNAVSTITEQDFYELLALLQEEVRNVFSIVFEKACLANCRNLVSISLPKDMRVTKIMEFAFANDASFIGFNGVDTIKAYIGTGAFIHCQSLTSNISVNNYNGIGPDTFCGCSSLKHIEINPGWKEYESQAIGDSAFAYCSSLESVSIPFLYTRIGNKAFYSCRSLRSIELGQNVTSIGSSAFSDCKSLRNIAWPENLSSIADNAFSNCRSLAEVSIPDTVTSIGSSVFSNCTNLKSLIISENLKSIEKDLISGCNNLELKILDNVRYLSTSKNPYFLAYGVESQSKEIKRLSDDCIIIGQNAFSECVLSPDFFITNKVRFILDSAFEASEGLREVLIPDSVIEVGDSAFAYCEDLEKAVISDGVIDMFCNAFSNCLSLKEVYIGNKIDVIATSTFESCEKLQLVHLSKKLEHIANKAFADCKLLKEIELPSSIKKIDFEAFEGCMSLEAITLPKSIGVIGYRAFYNCKKLKTINYQGNSRKWSKVHFNLNADSFFNPFPDVDRHKAWFQEYPSVRVIHCSDKDICLKGDK